MKLEREKQNPPGFQRFVAPDGSSAHPAGFDSVRSIVAQTPWSGLHTPFRANELESLPLRGQPTGLTLLSFATVAVGSDLQGRSI